MRKEVYILRGVPGSGKSSIAKSLSLGVDSVICEADQFFYDEYGNYNFDVSKLGKAHAYCKNKFIDAVNNNTQRIIVSNTNTKVSEFKDYKEIAEDNGYTVYVIIIENRHGNSNIHEVPHDKLIEMENRIKTNIKLI